MEYLIIELAVFLIFLFVQKISKLKIFKNRFHAFVVFFIALIIGSIWDNYAVWRGHWFYPGKGTLGIFFGYIPLEDYFFIIVVTYSIIVLYKFIEKKFKNKK